MVIGYCEVNDRIKLELVHFASTVPLLTSMVSSNDNIRCSKRYITLRLSANRAEMKSFFSSSHLTFLSKIRRYPLHHAHPSKITCWVRARRASPHMTLCRVGALLALRSRPLILHVQSMATD